MSGPILITVGNLLGKMHNRLPVRRRRLTRHEAMGLHHHGSGQFALPQRTRPRAGDEFNLRAQTPLRVALAEIGPLFRTLLQHFPFYENREFLVNETGICEH